MASGEHVLRYKVQSDSRFLIHTTSGGQKYVFRFKAPVRRKKIPLSDYYRGQPYLQRGYPGELLLLRAGHWDYQETFLVARQDGRVYDDGNGNPLTFGKTFEAYGYFNKSGENVWRNAQVVLRGEQQYYPIERARDDVGIRVDELLELADRGQRDNVYGGARENPARRKERYPDPSKFVLVTQPLLDATGRTMGVEVLVIDPSTIGRVPGSSRGADAWRLFLSLPEAPRGDSEIIFHRRVAEQNLPYTWGGFYGKPPQWQAIGRPVAKSRGGFESRGRYDYFNQEYSLKPERNDPGPSGEDAMLFELHMLPAALDALAALAL